MRDRRRRVGHEDSDDTEGSPPEDAIARDKARHTVSAGSRCRLRRSAAATVRTRATATRIADGRIHDLSRQQELLVLVAARVAGAEAAGVEFRRDRDPAARDGDAHRRSCAIRRRASCRRCCMATSSSGKSWRSANTWPRPFPRRGCGRPIAAARAMARAVSAEMHSGFAALRNHLPMNMRSTFPHRGVTPEVARRHQPHHRAFGATAASAFGARRRLPVRPFHHRRRDVRAGREPLPHLQDRARRGGAALCRRGLGASRAAGMGWPPPATSR